MLPAPLQRLQERYDQLIAAVQNNEMSVDDAQSALTQMVEVDGAGQHWSLDVQRRFVVADGPGQPAVPADPSRYQPAHVPADPSTSGLPPWANQTMMGSPHPADPTHVAGPQQGVHPVSAPSPLMHNRPVSMDSDGTRGPAHDLGERLSSWWQKLSSKAGSVGLLKDRRVVIGGAVVLLIVAVGVIRAVSSDPLDDAGIPVDTSALPADTGGDPSVVDPSAPVPGERVGAVIDAVTSGDRQQAAAAVVNPGTPTDVALQTGANAGIPVSGLNVTTSGPAVAAEDGTVTQVWQIVDADNAELIYATATVTWQQAEASWRLASWPSWQQTG